MLASYYDLKSPHFLFFLFYHCRACLSNPSLYEEQMVRRAIMDIPEFRFPYLVVNLIHVDGAQNAKWEELCHVTMQFVVLVATISVHDVC